jgi:hypothetical protein
VVDRRPAFHWFLASLRSHYLASEGEPGRLSALAFGGGFAASVIAMLIPVADEVGALNKDDVDASGAAVLHHFSDAFFVATEYMLPIFFFSSAILALRHGALPKWLGWFSILIGIVLLIGPIGWAALIFATPDLGVGREHLAVLADAGARTGTELGDRLTVTHEPRTRTRKGPP